jgi:hypothetical protein
MRLEEQTPTVQMTMYLLMAIFALGVAGGIITNALILWRTKALSTFPEEKSLSWGERKGRQFSRANSFLLDSRFKRLRIAMLGSMGLSIFSFALIAVIDGLWGH